MKKDWTPALEEARLQLCEWLLETAHNDQSLGNSVGAKLREAEQCITLLASLAAEKPPQVIHHGVVFDNPHTGGPVHPVQNCVACQREFLNKSDDTINRIATGAVPDCFSFTRAGSIAICQMLIELRGGPRQ